MLLIEARPESSLWVESWDLIQRDYHAALVDLSRGKVLARSRTSEEFAATLPFPLEFRDGRLYCLPPRRPPLHSRDTIAEWYARL